MVEIRLERQLPGEMTLWKRISDIRFLRVFCSSSILRRAWLSAPILSVSMTLVFLATQRCTAQNSESSVEQPKENYLELFVNSKDQKHFNAVIDRAVRLQERNLVPIAAIYHIGDFNSVTPEVRAKLLKGKLKLFALSGVPSDIPIKTSPAWIFVTLSGRRIVEGTFGIERFIDDHGSFRDGSQIRDPADAPPTPVTQKMEKF